MKDPPAATESDPRTIKLERHEGESVMDFLNRVGDECRKPRSGGRTAATYTVVPGLVASPEDLERTRVLREASLARLAPQVLVAPPAKGKVKKAPRKAKKLVKVKATTDHKLNSHSNGKRLSP